MSDIGLSILLASPQEEFLFLLGPVPVPCLPEGVLVEIMLHLDLCDILACRLVNKTWSKAAATGVRHLDVRCKALRVAGGAARSERVGTVLWRLHQAWPAAEALTLSGLSAAHALQEELSLQLIINHLSRWQTLRELHLRDVPVVPASDPTPSVRLAALHLLWDAVPSSGQANTRQSRGTAATGSRAITSARTTSTTGAANTAIKRETTSRWINPDVGSGGSGSIRYGDSAVPGPWGLGCLSCCLALTRLEVELVPASRQRLDPLPMQLSSGESSRGCRPVPGFEGEQRPHQNQPSRYWERRRQPGGLPEPAQLAADQAALLKGLTGLTRLTHLSIRLLDLPEQATAPWRRAATRMQSSSSESESESESEFADSGSYGGGKKGLAATGSSMPGAAGTAAGGLGALPSTTANAIIEVAVTAPIAAPAAMTAFSSADDYLLDIEEAGNYGSDLEMDLEASQDRDLHAGCRGLNVQLMMEGDHDRGPIRNVCLAASSVTEGPRGDTLRCANGESCSCTATADCSEGAGARRQLSIYQPLRSGTHDTTAAQLALVQPGDRNGNDNHDRDRDNDEFDIASTSSSTNSSSSSSSSGNGVIGKGGGEGGSAHVAVAVATTPSQQHWIPHPALFVRMCSRLRSLRLTGCDLRGGGALAALATTLTCLTSLSLQGRLAVSRDDLAALSRFTDLRDLTLSRVELLYDPREPDDCPVDLMAELYGALKELRHFQSLRFDLETHGGSSSGINSAYLLPLYESPLPHLQRLSLSMVLDSDYSFHMLAELTSLTALSLSYVTWPLALESDDMTLLAPLTGLRRFSMHAEPWERHHLVALSGQVVSELARAWPHLSQLAFTGQIQPDIPGAPSLEHLASWTSLRDLSLSAVPDPDDDVGCRLHLPLNGSITRGPGNCVNRRGLVGASQCPPACGRGGVVQGEGVNSVDFRAANFPQLYSDNDDDDDNSEAAEAVGALDLGVGLGRCLPPGLTCLALSGLRLSGGELLRLLSGPLKDLTSLQVLNCGLTPAHFMVGDCGAKRLQVLVLNDRRAWRACCSLPRNPNSPQIPAGFNMLGYTATAAASTGLQQQDPCGAALSDRSATLQMGRSSAASQSPFIISTQPTCICNCCCSPNLWTRPRCLAGSVALHSNAPHPLRSPSVGPLATRRGAACGPLLAQCTLPGQNVSRTANTNSGQEPQKLLSHTQERMLTGQRLRYRHDWHLGEHCGTMAASCMGENDISGFEQSDDHNCQVSMVGGSRWISNNTGQDVGVTEGEGSRVVGRGGHEADLERGATLGAVEEGHGYWGAAGSCSCWRQYLLRHGLKTLGSLHSLEFMLLGLPDDELAVVEVLRPLAGLTGLRCLTMHAWGLQATDAKEVSELLGYMTQLRNLRLMGPRADSAVAQGVEDAVHCLPYLKV